MGSRSSSPISSRVRSRARSVFCRGACWWRPKRRRRRGAFSRKRALPRNFGMADATLRSDRVSEDAYLGGRLRLRQPHEGHRAGSDAILLAAAAPETISGVALDLGAGVGAAGLALAALRS